MLIISESHVFYLDGFYNQFSYTTLYIQPHTTEEEMIRDIIDSANTEDVAVFTFKRSPRNAFLTEYDVFGTDGAEKYINQQLNIVEREYRSLFLGDVRFRFHDFEDISGIKDFNDYYVIGSDAKVHQFKMNLIDKYAGNHPEEGDEGKDLRNTALFIWFLVIGIILVLTYYDVRLHKKENLIRISLGERTGKVIWGNIALDAFVLVLIFTAITYMLSKVTYIHFMFGISISAFLSLLIMNGIIYLTINFYNIKEAFSNDKYSRKLLSINYTLKFVSVLLTVFIISGNLALTVEAYNLYRQKSFFQEYKDYSYTRFEYKPTPKKNNTLLESAKVQMSFYNQFFDKFDATLLVSTDTLLNGKGILANQHAYDYLSSQIREARNLSLTKDVYFFLPKHDQSIPQKELDQVVHFYFGEQISYEFETIFYEEKIEIIRIDENHQYGSELIKRPIIIMVNMDPQKLNKVDERKNHQISILHEVMYKIANPDDVTHFIEEYGLQNQIVSKTNVLENYNRKWLEAKRILYLNVIFTVLILLLEFTIINTIIRMEYEVNAIELSIKKVLGYSLLEKNRKIILITITTTAISIILSIILARIIGFHQIYYLALGGSIIMVSEVLLISFYIRKIERSKIPKILKGGNV